MVLKVRFYQLLELALYLLAVRWFSCKDCMAYYHLNGKPRCAEDHKFLDHFVICYYFRAKER